MRKIKFRGKRVDNGEFIYGLVAYLFDLDYISKSYDDVPERKYYISYDSGSFIEVDPNTVGQCTGLKDKSGVEIYEGDILQSESNMVNAITNQKTGEVDISIYKVIWHEIGWGIESVFCNRWNDSWNNKGRKQEITLGCLKYYSVIGNINDNPELLE